MTEKFAFSYDKDFFFNGLVRMQPCQIELGRFYLPARATEVKPPEPIDGKRFKWIPKENRWIYVDIDVHIVRKPDPVVEVVKPPADQDLNIVEERFKNFRVMMKVEFTQLSNEMHDMVGEHRTAIESKLEAVLRAADEMREVYADCRLRVDNTYHLVESQNQTIANLNEMNQMLLNRINEVEEMLVRMNGGTVPQPVATTTPTTDPEPSKKKRWF